MKYTQKFSYLALVLWGVLLIYVIYFYMSYDISFEDMIFWAKNFVLENPLQGILFFILLYCIRPLFFIIATPFDLFSGMVFGPIYWFLVSITACFFSAMFSYMIGRITGPGILSFWNIRKNKDIKRESKFKKRLLQDTFFTLLTIRFLMLPFDLSNYIVGILKAPFFPFLAGSVLWIAPITFIIVSAGSAFYGKEITSYESLLENIQYENLIFSSFIFLILLLLARVLRKKYKDIHF